MVIPVLKRLSSPDLNRDSPPRDADDCALLIQAEIGPQGGDGADTFSFVALTPARLARKDAQWGRGLLILPTFTWEAVERAVTKLLLHAHRPTWPESAAELAKEVHWEFEGYRA